MIVADSWEKASARTRRRGRRWEGGLEERGVVSTVMRQEAADKEKSEN